VAAAAGPKARSADKKECKNVATSPKRCTLWHMVLQKNVMSSEAFVVRECGMPAALERKTAYLKPHDKGMT
jgi:hypothetical protein